jgi:hypothetical protein
VLETEFGGMEFSTCGVYVYAQKVSYFRAFQDYGCSTCIVFTMVSFMKGFSPLSFLASSTYRIMRMEMLVAVKDDIMMKVFAKNILTNRT